MTNPDVKYKGNVAVFENFSKPAKFEELWGTLEDIKSQGIEGFVADFSNLPLNNGPNADDFMKYVGAFKEVVGNGSAFTNVPRSGLWCKIPSNMRDFVERREYSTQEEAIQSFNGAKESQYSAK